MFFNATPVPFATAWSGSSAMWKGILILSVRRLSSHEARHHRPPDKCHYELYRHTTQEVYFQCTQYGRFNLGNWLFQTMSHFLITYGNFHRKRSDTIRTVNNIIFRGTSPNSVSAAPTLILIRSAIRSLTFTLCWRLIYSWISAVRSSPAIRIELLETYHPMK